ncbi:histidine phosphatase family protein [Enterococcus sp. LJL99]
MTIFYCVRHGKTIFNQQGYFQGGIVDSALIEEGINGAIHMGKQLRSIHFDKVLVSPLKRAQDTCKLILNENNYPHEVLTIPELREMEFGKWEGKREADYRHLEEFQQLVKEPHLYKAVASEGETFEDVLTRSFQFFERIAQENPDATVLIVSHGLLLQSFIKTIQGVKLADIRKGTPLKNTSVSIIESTDEGQSFMVNKWNCIEL